MNWDDLRVFLAVARAQRLDVAARTVSLDATTVGRRIARLEAALGTTFFKQSRSGHVLTEAGQRLLAQAEAVECAALAASNQSTDARPELSGLVRVSVSEGFGAWVIARHLPEFHSRHPALTVDLVASGGFLSPSKREADIAVMLARPVRGPLVTRRLSDYRLKLYAARGYLDRMGSPGAVEELRRHALVGYVPDLISVPQQRLLEEVVPDPAPALRSTSINAQTALIAAGAGIGVLPCFIGAQSPGLQCVLEREVALTRSFWLVVHRDVRRLARVDAFVRWIVQLVASNRPLLWGTD